MSTATASAFYLFQAFTALLLFLAANTSASTRSRGSPRSSPRTATCPASSRFRGDRLAFSLRHHRCWASSPRSLVVVFGGADPRAHPAVRGRRVHRLHDQPGAAWSGTGCATRAPGWRRRLAINAFGASLTGDRRGRRDVVKFRRRRWLVARPHPDPGRASCCSSAASTTPRRRSSHVRDDVVLAGPAPRAARGRPGQRHQPGGRPGRQLRARRIEPTTSGPSTSPRTSRRPTRCATRWERQLPGVPLVIVESPYRAVVSPVVAYLDVLDQAWPPDKEAPITIVVLPEYVARHWWDRLLYNQTAKRLQGRARRARAHRHRRRPVPARGATPTAPAGAGATHRRAAEPVVS